MPAWIIVFSSTTENLEFGELFKWVYVPLSSHFWASEEQRILYVKAQTMLQFYLSWELSAEKVQKYGGEEEELSWDKHG